MRRPVRPVRPLKNGRRRDKDEAPDDASQVLGSLAQRQRCTCSDSGEVALAAKTSRQRRCQQESRPSSSGVHGGHERDGTDDPIRELTLSCGDICRSNPAAMLFAVAYLLEETPRSIHTKGIGHEVSLLTCNCIRLPPSFKRQISLPVANRRWPWRRCRMIPLVLGEHRFKRFLRPKFRRADFFQAGSVPI